jgi:hypothetical protein
MCTFYPYFNILRAEWEIGGIILILGKSTHIPLKLLFNLSMFSLMTKISFIKLLKLKKK